MRLTILIPDAGDLHRYDDWHEQAEQLRPLLNAYGIAPDYRAWTDTAPLDADLVLPLMAWGYHRDLARWYAQLDRWGAADVRFANPLPMLRWNADKRYLLALAQAGVAIVPTHTPEEAVEELEYAVKEMGFRVVLFPSYVKRPIAAAVRYRAPFLSVIYQNRSYSTGTRATAQYYPDGYAVRGGLEAGYFDPPIDFAKEAEAAGAYGENVKDPSEVGPALRRGLDHIRRGAPAVIAVWLPKLMREE